jgi:hypothetical protein
MKPTVVAFLGGMLAMGYFVAAAFFFRFWKQTRDRLFVFFAMAFVLLAVQRVLLAADFSLTEDRTWMYVLRLIAFLLIAYAIVAKNRENTE